MADQMRGWERKHIFFEDAKRKWDQAMWRFHRRHPCHKEAFLIAVSQSGHWAEEGQETAVWRTLFCPNCPDWTLLWRKGEKTDVKIFENPKQGLCSQGQEASQLKQFPKPRKSFYTYSRRRYNVYRFEALDGKCELAHLLTKWTCSLKPPF